MAIEGYQLPGCGVYNSAYFSPTNSGQWSNAAVYDSACGGVDMVGSIPNDNVEHTVYENANGKITIQVFQRWNYGGTTLSRANLNVYAVVNGTMTKISSVYVGEMNAQAIVFAVDHETHYGYCNYFGMMNYYSPGDVYRTSDSIQSNTNRQALYNFLTSYSPIIPITSNGGGATHIAKVTGQLSSLSNNLSDILMVSGGGGGGLIVGEDTYAGKEAGGISGSGDNSADQSTGNAFGQGESGTNVSGGGSGLYGGYKGTSSKSGGAGSGYIGNSLISNKKMVGYNVPTSSAESTKTESVEDASESPVSGKPKIGNGYAKIKFIKETPVPPSNYIAWLDPEFGVNNLVISKPLQATNVKVVEDYYVADTSSSWSSFIVIPIGMPFTSDIDLIIDLDVYVGNEDNENNTDYGFELYFNLNRNNSRVLGMTMRNSRWASGANINYDIWGNTELHGISSVFDNTNNNYKWANLKVVLGFRSGQWVSSKSYIDDTLFQEYTYSGKNMGSNNIDNIETALPANACTYRIKSYKVYTQTPS